MWREALEAVLLRQLLQPGSQLPVGHLNLLELQLALTQLDTVEENKHEPLQRTDWYVNQEALRRTSLSDTNNES